MHGLHHRRDGVGTDIVEGEPLGGDTRRHAGEEGDIVDRIVVEGDTLGVEVILIDLGLGVLTVAIGIGVVVVRLVGDDVVLVILVMIRGVRRLWGGRGVGVSVAVAVRLQREDGAGAGV